MALQAKCHVFAKVSHVIAGNKALCGEVQETRRTTESGDKRWGCHTASPGLGRKWPGENCRHYFHYTLHLAQLNSFTAKLVFLFFLTTEIMPLHYKIFEKYRNIENTK